MNDAQIEELVLQSLEHEKGGIEVYRSAIECAVNRDLKKEWQEYLEQTRTHVTTLETVCKTMRIDSKKETPGRKVVRHLGGALVQAMKMAREAGNPTAAELVACECVVLAETKDHLDWELLGKCADQMESAEALQSAVDTVEDQEDEHLYHSRGWCRELWIQSLGMPAVLPPPEERRKVKTAIAAARAEAAADRARLPVDPNGPSSR